MSLFKFKSIILLSHIEFIELFLFLSSFQLSDSVFGHLCLNVFSVIFTLLLVLKKNLNKFLNVSFTFFLILLFAISHVLFLFILLILFLILIFLSSIHSICFKIYNFHITLN